MSEAIRVTDEERRYNVKLCTGRSPDPAYDYPQLKVFGADYFNKTEIKPPEPIIDKLLYPGLGMLGAPAKMGKSYLVLQLCCCVAAGDPFLGFEVKRPGAVLYLDLQGNPARTKKRLLDIGYPEIPENLHVAYEAQSTDNHFLNQLEDWIIWRQETEAKRVLIVIDMLQQVKGRMKSTEDAYTADNRILEPLHALAIKRNVCIMTVMHTRKGNQQIRNDGDPFNEIIGSIGQFGTADCAWMIIGKREEEEKRLSVICRDCDEGQQDYKVTFKSHRWSMLGSVEDLQKQHQAEEYQKSPVVFTLKGLATESGWQGTMKELLQEIVSQTGVYPAASPEALKRIVDGYKYKLFLDGVRIEPAERGRHGQLYRVSRVVVHS